MGAILCMLIRFEPLLGLESRDVHCAATLQQEGSAALCSGGMHKACPLCFDIAEKLSVPQIMSIPMEPSQRRRKPPLQRSRYLGWVPAALSRYNPNSWQDLQTEVV